jgi:hypothetical protein
LNKKEIAKMKALRRKDTKKYPEILFLGIEGLLMVIPRPIFQKARGQILGKAKLKTYSLILHLRK